MDKAYDSRGATVRLLRSAIERELLGYTLDSRDATQQESDRATVPGQALGCFGRRWPTCVAPGHR